MYHLMAIFGDEVLVMENAKCVDFAWSRKIMILFRNPRLRAEKTLEQAVGLYIPLEEASFMITRRAANEVGVSSCTSFYFLNP